MSYQVLNCKLSGGLGLHNEQVIKFYRWKHFLAARSGRFFAMALLAEWEREEREKQSEPTATCNDKSVTICHPSYWPLPGQGYDRSGGGRAGR